nr:MAG TPA: hypothetical protein [Caudoviricetes sp.]
MPSSKRRTAGFHSPIQMQKPPKTRISGFRRPLKILMRKILKYPL